MPTTETVSDAPEPTEIETPDVFVFVFGLPVFMVVLWFMIRLFTGRWITDPTPPPFPLGEPPGPSDPPTPLDPDDRTG